MQALSKNGKVFGNGIMVGVQMCIDKVGLTNVHVCIVTCKWIYYASNTCNDKLLNVHYFVYYYSVSFA